MARKDDPFQYELGGLPYEGVISGDAVVATVAIHEPFVFTGIFPDPVDITPVIHVADPTAIFVTPAVVAVSVAIGTPTIYITLDIEAGTFDGLRSIVGPYHVDNQVGSTLIEVELLTLDAATPIEGITVTNTQSFTIDFSGGTGTLPSVGDTITWPGGGIGIVSATTGTSATGTVTITYIEGGDPAIDGTATSGGWTANVDDSTFGLPPTYEIDFSGGTGTLPVVGEVITWTGGGTGTVTGTTGTAATGTVTVAYGSGVAPGGSMVSGGGWTATIDATGYAVGVTEPFVATMTVELRSSAGAFLSALVTQSDAQFQDPFNDVGAGRFTLQLDDPDKALVVVGTEVWCYLYGQHVYTWVVLQKPRIVRIDEGEESRHVLQVTGRGRAELLQKAKIYPPKGTLNPINAQHRLYSFASIDYPNLGATFVGLSVWSGWGPVAYSWPAIAIHPDRAVIVTYTDLVPLSTVTEDTPGVDWDLAQELLASGADDPSIEIDVGSEWVPAPQDYPIQQSYWIWPTSDPEVVGTAYFRKTFQLWGETNCAICVSGDNFYTLYLDGTPILGELANMACWRDYKRVDITLPAGTYTLAAMVVNAPWPPQYANPGGFVCGIAALDAGGEPGPAICVSDSSWIAMINTNTAEPGWTPGQIVIDAVGEAQARGALSGFTLEFTAFTDSGGQAWPFVRGFAVNIGGSILDMLKGLVEQGWIDWRVKHGGRVLQMFNAGTIDRQTGVSYEATGSLATQNLESLQFVPQNEVVNRFLVKWTYGYFQIDDAASQAAYGVYEGFMTVDAPTLADATQQAQVVLEEAATPRHAIVASIDPLGPADRPYTVYGPGESVQVISPEDALTYYPVKSITVGQTELGRPDINLELLSRLAEREREDFELLQSIGRAIVGDTSQRIVKLASNSETSNAGT